MECKKCLVDVPSQFEYVLVKNVCPKCGNKLMADQAMKVYIDLKKRLNEVEFVMDKATVCERVAMFVVTNYEILPLGPISQSIAVSTTTAEELAPLVTTAPTTVADKRAADSVALAKFKAELASIAENDLSLSADEIRAEEAARAEELAIAREIGMDVDGLEDGEEMVSGKVDPSRVQRLKKLAATAQITKTGQAGMIKRSSHQ